MTLALCSSTLFFANQKETVSLENEKNQTIENVDLNEIELSNKMKSIVKKERKKVKKSSD